MGRSNHQAHRITHALMGFFWRLGHRYMCPNIYRGQWEHDLLIVTKSEYVIECEVKVSRSDFIRDFTKKKHQVMQQVKLRRHLVNIIGAEKCPNRFYFCCEEGLISPDEIPDYCGLITIDRLYQVGLRNWYAGATIVKKTPLLHNHKFGENEYKELALKLTSKYIGGGNEPI